MICNYLIFDIISKIKYNIYNFTISKVLGGDWMGLYDFMVEKYGYDEVILYALIKAFIIYQQRQY